MGKNRFPNAWPSRQSDPGAGGAAITPGTSALATPTRGIYVGVGGNMVIITMWDEEVFYENLVGGITHPIRAKKVLATGTDSPASTTTASSLIGVY